MSLFVVTYTKRFKGKKELLTKEVEAETSSKAQTKVRHECEAEVKIYIREMLEAASDNGYIVDMGGRQKTGVWRAGGLSKPNGNGRQERVKGNAILVFSDFTAVPKE